MSYVFFFFFQAEDGIRDLTVTGVQTCALPISRRRSTGQLPVSAFHSAIGPESHPHRCKREPETHQRPSSPNRHALAPRVHRQHRDQIAIAPASASAPHLPRVPSLEAFGRRPPCKPNRRDGPASETLRKSAILDHRL